MIVAQFSSSSSPLQTAACTVTLAGGMSRPVWRSSPSLAASRCPPSAFAASRTISINAARSCAVGSDTSNAATVSLLAGCGAELHAAHVPNKTKSRCRMIGCYRIKLSRQRPLPPTFQPLAAGFRAPESSSSFVQTLVAPCLTRGLAFLWARALRPDSQAPWQARDDVWVGYCQVPPP